MDSQTSALLGHCRKPSRYDPGSARDKSTTERLGHANDTRLPPGRLAPIHSRPWRSQLLLKHSTGEAVQAAVLLLLPESEASRLALCADSADCTLSALISAAAELRAAEDDAACTPDKLRPCCQLLLLLLLSNCSSDHSRCRPAAAAVLPAAAGAAAGGATLTHAAAAEPCCSCTVSTRSMYE
jgi:hypothetical protein